jgi:hypothetical protein
MSDIEQLRRRVEAAERHFGTVGEQQGKYSARLIQLMDQIEQRAAERESELSRYLGELQQLRRDHDQVKVMLQTLLSAIEAGGGDALMAALHEMDRKASALVGEGPIGETPFAAKEKESFDDVADLEVTGPEDFRNGFEDVTPETLAAEEAEAQGEAEIGTAADRFEDVTPETLAAEAAEEQAAIGEDVIFPEAQTAPGAETETAISLPAAPESPVAGIIQRIGQLTRELAEQPLPAKTSAVPAEPVPAKLRRVAS